MKKATIYTTTSCVYCKMTKEFFKQNNVSYEEHDVGVDPVARQKMLDISGQMGVPVITVEAETEPIIGFDRPRLVKALGL